MFWRMILEEGAAACEPEHVDGRFVLHQHSDRDGAHLDLRLEQDGYCLGWRIAGHTLDGEPWATRKAPHPALWLDRDGEAVRVDSGIYSWVECGSDRRVLVLDGRNGVRQLRVEREPGLPLEVIRSVSEAIRDCGVDVQQAGRLVSDGMTARRRAIERLCGLGRELDGTAFDDGVWRRILAGLSLEEIHAQLRAYEVRFDQKYPPDPVSRPESLPEMESDDPAGMDRAGVAMAIVRE